MQIHEIQLTSSKIFFGPAPHPEDEVEQHLTISASGHIWFTGYKYGGGYGKYKICREQQLNIEKIKSEKIFDMIKQYFEDDPLIILATDIGDWELLITDTNQKVYKFKGSMCGEITVGNIDLTHYIRKQIPIADLLVFDTKVRYDYIRRYLSR